MTYTPACWFPCLVHILETEPNEEIKSRCLETRANNPEGVGRSNEGGWQSSPYLYNDSWESTETGTVKSPHMTASSSEFIIKEHLTSLIEQSVQTVVNGHVQLFNYWVNINGPGAYNVAHNHPQSHFSGVYYVHCPENSGEIIFNNPFGFTAFDELSCYKDDFTEHMPQHKSISIKPVDGLLLMFPSHLEHCVSKNQSDEDRISIAFNCHVVPTHEQQFYK